MKKYVKSYCIPQYLIQGFGDSGITEVVHSGEFIEKDDLRIHIELSGGTIMVIDDDQRLRLTSEGVIVEKLTEI